MKIPKFDKRTVQFILLLASYALAFTIALLFGIDQGKKSVEPAKPTTHYVTDTVWSVKPYIPVKPPKGKEVKPITITIYPQDSALAHKNTLRANDSLIQIIKHTKGRVDTITLKPSFLTLYPESPKLISLNLVADRLSLTLLDFKSQLGTSDYPLDLTRYSYTFTGNSLTRYENHKRPRDGLRSSQGLVLATYTLTTEAKYPGIKFQYNYHIGKLMFQASSDLYIGNTLVLGIQGGLGVKLW